LNTKAKARAARKTREASLVADLNDRLAQAAREILSLRKMVDEVAEDNMALMEAVKRVAEGQDAARSAVVRELDLLRSQIAAELRFQWLRGCCREMAPVRSALERIAAGADYSNAEGMRQHMDSLALSLEGVFRRIGIEQMPVLVGEELFDSSIHDCVKVCRGADSPVPGAAARTVVFVEEHGYLVDGRVAVPAKVWVQKNEEQNLGKEEASAS
jgi:molecular chaperone GrpE (heat shock protein)